MPMLFFKEAFGGGTRDVTYGGEGGIAKLGQWQEREWGGLDV